MAARRLAFFQALLSLALLSGLALASPAHAGPREDAEEEALRKKSEEVLRFAADSGRIVGAAPRCGLDAAAAQELRDGYLDRIFSSAVGPENFRAAQDRFTRGQGAGEKGVINDSLCRNVQTALEELRAAQ